MINLSTQFGKFSTYYSDEYNLVVPLEDENIQANEGLASFQEASIKIESGVYDNLGIFYKLGNSSGTVISPDGLVLTAAHCVSDQQEDLHTDDADFKYLYSLINKHGYSYRASVLKAEDNGDLVPEDYKLEVLDLNYDDDIAICRLVSTDPNKEFQFIGINEWGNDFNDSLFTLSHPSGSESAVISTGATFDLSLHRQKEKSRAREIRSNLGISSVDTSSTVSSGTGLSHDDVLALKAYVAPGSSGGTVLNKFGDLVGVITHGGHYSSLDYKLMQDETVMTVATKATKVLDFLKTCLEPKQYQNLLDANKVFA